MTPVAPQSNSTVTGPPLDTIADLIGGPRVDDLLRRAAERAPERFAVRTPRGDISYADLDSRVDAGAVALRRLVGTGEVVALAAELHEAFTLAFFAISRSDNVSALINPLLREDGLVHVLGVAQARAAIVSPEVYQRLLPIRERLPELRHLVLTHRSPELADDDTVSTVDELVAGERDSLPPEASSDQDDLACLQFTSGTTGPPKAVRLSHRNLTVNAAQSGHAHGLTADAVVFNYLPTFHLMHLTITVAATATLVLWTGDNPVEAAEAANSHAATHFYSLPVRLSRLAADPALAGVKIPTLRAFLCGGSALPPTTTGKLIDQFQVPVVQGYGLQETSPSTHFDSLERPKLRSSGRPVAGTESRIVHVDTGDVQPVDKKGEIQVRGPQLMLGYLDRDLVDVVDADGWFSTGDIGYVDEDGYLFVVDRIKDVFKCDNWLVSPTEIERELLRHAGVRECVVVDFPDEFRGAVAYAMVVPADGAVQPEDLQAFIADRLPYYEHLHHVDLVDTIPRSPTGKVQRRDLREHLVRTHTTRRTALYTFINRFTVNGDIPQFLKLLDDITGYMAQQPGFVSHKLYRSALDPHVYLETAEWENAGAHRQATSGAGFREPVQQVMKLATAEPAPFEVVAQH